MAEPFIGEIKLVGFNFAPVGWANCNGQLLPISQNDALFALIGTTYGGDGQETFALPDLQGRVPVHQGVNSSFSVIHGETGGVETVFLQAPHMPQHSHELAGCATPGNTREPTGGVYSAIPNASRSDLLYGGSPSAQAAPGAITAAGGSQEHTNLQPYLGIRYIIALFGIFPPQN